MTPARLGWAGVALVFAAAAFWALTYLPPATMTSIALEAMAAYGCATLGIGLFIAAAVVRLRT